MTQLGISRYECFGRIVELVRIAQRRSRFVGTAYGSELTLLEAYVLLEIGRDPTLSIGEIATLLISDRSTVSRIISGLKKSGYIKNTRSSLDARKRIFQLLKRGFEFIKKQDEESRAFLAIYLTHLTPSEIAVMRKAQHLMSDAVGAPQVQLRHEEHPFEEGIRRFTRAFGLTGHSLFGSGHPSTEWQILAAIRDNDGNTTLSELQQLLSMHLATLSQTISRYEKQGWIKRVISKADRRTRNLFLTKSGLRNLESIHRAGIDILARAFQSSGDDFVIEFLRVFTKHMHPPSRLESFILRPALVVEELTDDRSREDARGFLLFHRVRLGWISRVPEVLISRSSRTFVLREGEIKMILVECTPTPEGFFFSNLCYNEAVTDLTLLESFLIRVINITRKDQLDLRYTIDALFLEGWKVSRITTQAIDNLRSEIRVIEEIGD